MISSAASESLTVRPSPDSLGGMVHECCDMSTSLHLAASSSRKPAPVSTTSATIYLSWEFGLFSTADFRRSHSSGFKCRPPSYPGLVRARFWRGLTAAMRERTLSERSLMLAVDPCGEGASLGMVRPRCAAMFSVVAGPLKWRL